MGLFEPDGRHRRFDGVALVASRLTIDCLVRIGVMPVREFSHDDDIALRLRRRPCPALMQVRIGSWSLAVGAMHQIDANNGIHGELALTRFELG